MSDLSQVPGERRPVQISGTLTVNLQNNCTLKVEKCQDFSDKLRLHRDFVVDDPARVHVVHQADAHFGGVGWRGDARTLLLPGQVQRSPSADGGVEGADQRITAIVMQDTQRQFPSAGVGRVLHPGYLVGGIIPLLVLEVQGCQLGYSPPLMIISSCPPSERILYI